MSKLNEDELMILERYARDFRRDIDEFKKFSKLIKFSEEQELINEAAIELLERKYKEMAEAKNYKKLNKVIKVRRIVGDYDGKE